MLKQIESALKGNDKAALATIKMAAQVGLLEASEGAGETPTLSASEQEMVNELVFQGPREAKGPWAPGVFSCLQESGTRVGAEEFEMAHCLTPWGSRQGAGRNCGRWLARCKSRAQAFPYARAKQGRLSPCRRRNIPPGPLSGGQSSATLFGLLAHVLSKRRSVMSKDPPTVEMISDGDDLFVVVNGVKVAKRGRPGTAQANTWVSLGPGWTVLDRNYPEEIEVMFEGVRISLIERVRQDE